MTEESNKDDTGDDLMWNTLISLIVGGCLGFFACALFAGRRNGPGWSN